jgi:hypothetical protein
MLAMLPQARSIAAVKRIRRISTDCCKDVALRGKSQQLHQGKGLAANTVLTRRA